MSVPALPPNLQVAGLFFLTLLPLCFFMKHEFLLVDGGREDSVLDIYATVLLRIAAKIRRLS